MQFSHSGCVSDEDRLSRRKSIVDTISLQMDTDLQCSSDAPQVCFCQSAVLSVHLDYESTYVPVCVLQKPQTEQITFETLKNVIGKDLVPRGFTCRLFLFEIKKKTFNFRRQRGCGRGGEEEEDADGGEVSDSSF